MDATFEQQIFNLQPNVAINWIERLNNEFNWNITFEQGTTKSETYDNARQSLYNAFHEHQINGLVSKKRLIPISASGKINVNNQSYNAIDKLIEKVKKKQQQEQERHRLEEQERQRLESERQALEELERLRQERLERQRLEELERQRLERERLRQERLAQQQQEQRKYNRIKTRLNKPPEFEFNFIHFKPFTKSTIQNWISTLNTEFNWNIQYQQDATGITLYNRMKQSLVQALNEHRVYDIVYEYMNQDIVNRWNAVEYELIDDIVKSIKLFNRYQHLEDNQYFKEFDRDRYKITEPIDEFHRLTTHDNLDKQRQIQYNIRIAREALDNAINLIKDNQHAILVKQRNLERVNNNPELYEYLEHHKGKIDKSNYDGQYLIINEPHDKDEALEKLNNKRADKEKDASIQD